MTDLNLTLFTGTLILIFAVIEPVLGRRHVAGLRDRIAAGNTGARIRSYRFTMATEWGLTLVLLPLWYILGGNSATVGLVPAVQGLQWIAIAAALLGAGLVAVQSRRAESSPEALADARRQLGQFAVVAPRTGPELRHFAALSVTAGICEEILYRGLLMGALTAGIGLWPAVLVSSVVFGLGHAYQGAAGVVRVSAIGVVLALVTVFSGSVFAAIVLHAVIDLAQGRMIQAAMKEPELPIAEAQLA